MKTSEKKNSFSLFNLIALLSFVFGLFLIMFLKQNKRKENKQPLTVKVVEKSRVQILPTKCVKVGKINSRQAKILETIKRVGNMDPSEIYKLTPNVSTRTVRRDMDSLVEKGFVSQRGSTKSTTYEYIGG